MANYPTKKSIELVHGMKNITKWADLDNDINTNTINDRIAWSSELATEYVNGRLMLGRYAIPFVAVPKMVIHISSLLAGILLHDGRVVSDQLRDMVAPKRKEFIRLLRQILGGQLKLLDPMSGEPIATTCYTAPFVITADTVLHTDCCTINGLRFQGLGMCASWCSAWCNTCCCHTCICRSLMYPDW